MIYKHPDLDAAVSITRRNNVIQLDFLAKGRSQQRKGGKVVGYAKRNPDRRQLVDHVLAALEDVVGPFIVGSQGGKGGGDYVHHLGTHAARGSEARKSYSQAGNYRWRLFVAYAYGGRMGPKLGLEPTEHKPVTTTWPDHQDF